MRLCWSMNISAVFLSSAAVWYGQGNLPHGCAGCCRRGRRWANVLCHTGDVIWICIKMYQLVFCFIFILADHLGHSHILLATFEKVRAEIIIPEIWIIYSWFITIHYYDVLSILNSKNRLIFYRCINNTYNCCLLCQHMDGSYCVKPLKQKQVVNTSAFLLSLHLTSFCVATSFFWQRHTKALFPPWNSRLARESGRLYSSLCSFSQVDGVSYLLQEIYGIENKYNSQESKVKIGKHMKRFRAL